MARSNPRSRLRRLDLPAFGSPQRTRRTPSRRIRPSSAVVEQPFDSGTDLADLAIELLACARVNAFFRKIDVGFEMGDDPEQKTSDLLDLATEAARELFLGEAQGERGAGADDIHDRFGLGQVHLAIEKCSSREFSGLGRAGPCRSTASRMPGGDQHASMAMEFCHIFSRVAARRAKDDSHALIQLALPHRESSRNAACAPKGVRSVLSREKTLGDRGSLRSGKSNNGDGTFAGRASRSPRWCLRPTRSSKGPSRWLPSRSRGAPRVPRNPSVATRRPGACFDPSFRPKHEAIPAVCNFASRGR